MEHAVYICSWSKSPASYTLWVKSKPHVRAEGPTYAEAEARLMEKIQEAGGAMHAVLEFDPPLPGSELAAKYTTPELYLIGGDDRFETDHPNPMDDPEAHLSWIDSFFVSPICRDCHAASSPRSEKPLALRCAPSRYDGGFGYVGQFAGSTHQIFSEAFLELLSAAETDSLQLRPVARNPGRRKFYELLGPEGTPLVAVNGLSISGWRCKTCGRQTWGYWIEGLNISKVVARSDLPAPLPGVFTVGRSPDVHLAVTAERWSTLVGRNGTRGFTSSLLGVVPNHEVVRNPMLPTKEEAELSSATAQ